MIDIDKVNEIAENATVSAEPIYTVGMEIGIVDPISRDFSKEAVEWFTIVYIEPDFDIPIGWLYLMPVELSDEEVYQKILPNGTVISYTRMDATISDYIVLP